jgi:hypothetical protein
LPDRLGNPPDIRETCLSHGTNREQGALPIEPGKFGAISGGCQTKSTSQFSHFKDTE